MAHANKYVINSEDDEGQQDFPAYTGLLAFFMSTVAMHISRLVIFIFSLLILLQVTFIVTSWLVYTINARSQIFLILPLPKLIATITKSLVLCQNVYLTNYVHLEMMLELRH